MSKKGEGEDMRSKANTSWGTKYGENTKYRGEKSQVTRLNICSASSSFYKPFWETCGRHAEGVCVPGTDCGDGGQRAQRYYSSAIERGAWA